MRRPADASAVLRLVSELGRRASQPAAVYLVGGSSAVLEGWRTTTADVDLRLEPDADELLRAIAELKDRLSINVELASPLDFLPEVPGWRDRSPFVQKEGPLTVRHFDFSSQALAKLERAFDQDLTDVEAMLSRGLIQPAELRRLFDSIEPELYRFPAVDPAGLKRRVAALGG